MCTSPDCVYRVNEVDTTRLRVLTSQMVCMVGRSGPNLEPGTMLVDVTNGPRNGLHIGRKVGPCPGSRRRWVLGNVHAVLQASHAASTCRPRFQVRARPSYIGCCAKRVHPYWSTPKLSCTSQSSFYRSLHLHCSHYCNTIARLMLNIRPPPNPLCVCHTPYNIGSGNIV